MTELLSAVEINPEGSVKRVVIWLHGLGANGHDFEPIVPELRLPMTMGIRYVFPHAPEMPVTCNGGMTMPAWYDILGIGQNYPQDVAGFNRSTASINSLIERELANGVRSEDIVLAGFSQGGVIALHAGLRFPQKLGGIIALSTYVGAPETLLAEQADANKNIPIMMAHGSHDQVVPFAYGQQSAAVLGEAGYVVDWKSYPMEHSVCGEEIADISAFLSKVFAA